MIWVILVLFVMALCIGCLAWAFKSTMDRLESEITRLHYETENIKALLSDGKVR